MKHIKALLPFIFGIILTLVVIAGAVYFLSKPLPESSPVLEETQNNLVTPIPVSPSPSPITIPGWKTYRNEKYGFTFQYPSKYKADELDSHGDNVWVDLILQSAKSSDVILKVEIQRESQYADLYDFTYRNRPISVHQVIFAGKEVTATSYVPNTGPQMGKKFADSGLFFQNGPFLYGIYLNAIESEGGRTDDFENVLDSFRLFQPSSTIGATEWQTYTNDDYGFTFKYPPTTQQFDVTNKIDWYESRKLEGLTIEFGPEHSGTLRDKFAKTITLIVSRNPEIKTIVPNRGQGEEKIIHGAHFIIHPWVDWGGKHESQNRMIELVQDGVYYVFTERLMSICFDASSRAYDCPAGYTPEATFVEEKKIFDKILETFEFTVLKD